MSLNQTVRSILRRVVDRFQHTPHADAELIGNAGCAWCILPNRLSSNPVLFSGGAGNDISFEQTFLDRFGGRVFLYDPSPTGERTVRSSKPSPQLSFRPFALAANTESIEMEPPKSADEGSWTAPMGNSAGVDHFQAVSLVTEIKSAGIDYVDVVKLDIEGFEYEVVEELLDSDIRVGQILIEFHDFFPSIPKSRTDSLRRRLTAAGYACFYKKRYDFAYFKRE